MVETKNIPRGLEDYVEIKDGKILVNWDKLGKLKRKIAYGDIDLETFNLIFDNALTYLLDNGILTFSRKNTRRIVGVGGDFEPKTSYGQDCMTFTREKDAQEYLKAFHKYAVYSVGIEKLI